MVTIKEKILHSGKTHPPMWKVGEESARFIHFVEAAERIGATTKRNEKATLLGIYFNSLSDDDLTFAARFFSGYIFPLWDQRTTNVGGVALVTSIAAVTAMDVNALWARLVALGDLGAVALEAFSAAETTDKNSPALTLPEISSALEQLAATAGTKSKILLLIALLKKTTPLEAKYLVKLLVGDLRIGLKEGAVEDALARLFEVDVVRVQWANMLTGDIGEMALLGRKGLLAQAHMRLFHPIKFMLATLAPDLTEVAKQMPAEFFVEDKFDGIRAQAHIAPSLGTSAIVRGIVHQEVRVALFSRTLDEVTPSFPDLVAPLTGLLPSERRDASAGLILDGEIVAVQGLRSLPFLELQKRLGRKTPSEELRLAVPVAFIAFDLLYTDGQVLINEPLTRRRAILKALPFNGQNVRCAVSEPYRDPAVLDELYKGARARGNEGLMIKNPASPYKPGRRGRDWLKLKRALATLDVVVTAVEVGNGRRSHLLSDYTFAVRASETDPTLLNIGKAYSGLTDAELAELSEWFRAHTLKEFAHGKVRLVEPRIVLEVTFDLIQSSRRHKSGYALRFPRILHVRNDKAPEEIDTLETVRRLAEPHNR